MDNEEFALLAGKIADGTASNFEIALYNACYETYQQDSQSWAEMRLNGSKLQKQSLINFWTQVGKPQKKLRLWPRVAAAASIILCLSFGGYFLLHRESVQNTVQTQKKDIGPGGNKAILTLSNGKQIILTGAKNGVLATQGTSLISKRADGRVVYAVSKSAIETTVYNTMSTPRGGQYQLTLADGTNVWLNAASSIKYPTSFSRNDREVEITGEVYFEVTHNPSKPFRVKSNGQTVVVLGTRFNINAYADEPALKTTLLEGSVKIEHAGIQEFLIPGQQAIVENGNLKITKADTEAAIAWKNGDFIFKDDNLKTTMRKIARWYDVDVVYDQSAPSSHVPGGWISRSKNISSVLEIMEQTGKVHFKVEGRRIIVTK